MYFTQEDYRKIEAYLKSKAVRDTSFDSATTPLQGNETIVLVQGGKNVNTTVSDIVSQFFALGVSDFINVTDKYGISYNTLDEAIRVIPWRSRKVGQVITFLNEQGEWHLYQYQGESILTWNNTTLWVDLLESGIVNSILPDQEDLTMTEPDADGNSYMHFKDKDYSIDDFSGLGRVYLRKNLQTLTDPNTGETRLINYLTQTMVGKENVIYHIQYDYNLNGQTIIIPEGCVLLFEGGSISNGTVTGQDTKIIGSRFLDKSINLAGTFSNSCIYFDWFINEKWDISDNRYKTFINGNNNSFGEAPEIPTTNTDILTKIISLGNIIFGKGIYPFSSEINLSSVTKFVFNGIGSQDTLLWFPSSNAINIATSYGGRFCRIYNLSIEANGNVIRLQSPFYGMHGFRTDNCTFISYNDNAFHQDRTSGSVTATMYGARFTNLQVYAGRDKSVFYNIGSNSNVYINVVDALYYFDRQSVVGRKGIMKALLENSSCLEFSNSNILYAGMKYVAYIEGISNLALKFNNCVFEGSGNAMVGEDRKGFLNIIKYGGSVLASISYISFQSCAFVNSVYDKGAMIDAEGGNIIIIEPENTANLTIADLTTLNNKSDAIIYAYTKKIDAGATKRRLVLQAKSLAGNDLYGYSKELALSMGFSESFIDSVPDECSNIAVYRPAERETQLMLPPSYALPKGNNVLAWERNNFLTYKKGANTWLLNTLPSNNTFIINSYEDYSYHFSQNHQGRYIIVGNIDLGGNTINVRPNSVLDFQGGKISNGNINLNNTIITGVKKDISSVITATIAGTYGEGQVLYDSSLKEVKIWNGTAWTNTDGTLTSKVVIV